MEKIEINVFYDWITNNLEKGKTILELGSGVTTIKLTEDYIVHSIEHDEKFLNLAEDSNYIYAPIERYNGYRWYSIEKLNEIKDLEYDMILVDGPTGIIGRVGFLHNLDLFHTDVPILIDDTNRKPEMDLAINVSKKLGKEMFHFGGVNKNFVIIK